MEYDVNGTRILIKQGGITEEDVDAVVNAANKTLMGGGGVDGAIHDAAGEELQEACMQLRWKEYEDGLPTGEAATTTGGDLPADKVVHTVGPRWNGGEEDEAELLAACYRNSLNQAVQHDCRTVAFPAISTGAYGYPIEEASKVAVETVRDWVQEHNEVEEVRFILFTEDDAAMYEEAAEQLL